MLHTEAGYSPNDTTSIADVQAWEASQPEDGTVETRHPGL
jgi:hypothetical protein